MSRPVPPAPLYRGLEGEWSDTTDPRTTYYFRPDGRFASAWEGLPHGTVGTWTRDGAKVRVTTDRNWDFEGILNQGVLNGRMVERSTGNDLGPVTWRAAP